MPNPRDLKDPDWRKKYRHPSPPPGHVRRYIQIIEDTEVEELWQDLNRRLARLNIEILEDEPYPENDTTSDEEDEVIPIPVEPKIPEFIDLEPDLPPSPEIKSPSPPLSTSNIPPTLLTEASSVFPTEACSISSTLPKAPSITSALSRTSSVLPSLEPPVKLGRKEAKLFSKHRDDDKKDSDDSTYSSRRHRLKRKKKKHKERHSNPCSPYRKHSRSVSPCERNVRSPKRKKRSRSPRDRSRYSDSPSTSRIEEEMLLEHSRYTGSPSRRRLDYEEDGFKEVKVKKEYVKQEMPEIYADTSHNMYGSYYCPDCKATMTSEITWNTHITGKRHMKNLKARNPAAVIAQTVAANTAVRQKYNPESDKKMVVHVNETAQAQGVVESGLKNRIPGLHYVTEMRCLDKVLYICKLCDTSALQSSSLLPHLDGYKHALNLLKKYDVKFYDQVKDRCKKSIENTVYHILKDFHRREGFGQIGVEQEYASGAESSTDRFMSARDINFRRDMRDVAGSSSRSDDVENNYKKYLEPDTSKTDFYCRVCDSHMNSENAWTSHVNGQRHLKNIKKAPNELPSKAKSVKLPGERACIMREVRELQDAGEIFIGLNVIRETQNRINNTIQYTCFLCGGCMTELDVVDHLLSFKHKTKYLESINNSEYMTYRQLTIREESASGIIDDICSKVYNREGAGEVEVYIDKNSLFAVK